MIITHPILNYCNLIGYKLKKLSTNQSNLWITYFCDDTKKLLDIV